MSGRAPPRCEHMEEHRQHEGQSRDGMCLPIACSHENLARTFRSRRKSTGTFALFCVLSVFVPTPCLSHHLDPHSLSLPPSLSFLFFMRFDSRSYTHASRVCRVLALCSLLGVGVPYLLEYAAVYIHASRGHVTGRAMRAPRRLAKGGVAATIVATRGPRRNEPRRLCVFSLPWLDSHPR